MLAVIVVPLVFALTLLTFAWPSARLEPRDLPFGLAGPRASTQTVEDELKHDSGAFELHRYADEQAARDAIDDREIYGAVVGGSGQPKLLVASAASPVVAGSIERAFAEPRLAAAMRRGEVAAPRIEDVVPADTDDPRGVVLSSLVLPLVLSGVIAAVIVSLLGRPGLAQAGALIGAAVLAGIVGIAMVQTWLSAFAGPWLVNAGVLALTMLAISSVIAGLYGLIGTPGIALGALTMILLGNPWSGVSSAPELLPTGIGFIGQLLPPGAGGSLLRSNAFFDGAGSAGHLSVLIVWTALGLSAIWGATVLQRRRSATTEQVVRPAVPDPG